MTRELSDGNRVWGLLQLDELLIDKGRFVVHNDIGVKWTVLGLAFDGLSAGPINLVLDQKDGKEVSTYP